MWFLIVLVATGCASRQSASQPLPLPPLLEAARSGNTDRLRSVLDSGAAIDTRDDHGRTALHWAAISGSVDAVALLLDRGADVDIRAQFGMTPLHWSAMAGKANAADLLARRGANVSVRNSYGMTPLHMAATPDLIRVLLSRGATLDERDYRGMTPLHLARTSEVARTLMPAGSDPFVRAIDGRRPLDMAMGGDWQKSGLVIYASRAMARLRGEQGSLAMEILNVSERELGPFTLSAESPGCQVEVTPSSVARIDPGQLISLTIGFSRRQKIAEGEYPLVLSVAPAGRPVVKMSLSVNTSSSEVPEDRGMMRIGKVKVRRASSRLQYLAFAAVPVVLVGIWFLWRRRRTKSAANGRT